MRKNIILVILLPIFLLLIPLPTLESSQANLPFNATAPLYSENGNAPVSSDSFRILLTESNTVTVLSANDYIFGVLAAEMPALYHEEALKAQAVAAYTFACRRRAANTLKEYDISDDYTTDQAFITEAEAREKWGENADSYIQKLKSAVAETAGLTVTYDGELALTVYHSVSSGKTESAENVWGNKIPYLVSVDSSADRLAKNYLKDFQFTVEEFKRGLEKLCNFDKDEKNWVGKCIRTDSGCVKQINICGEALSGADVRTALSLTSSAFEISYKDGVFTVTCKGYGHGVGMSQHGANVMAQQGSDFKEILSHYYKGCKVERL